MTEPIAPTEPQAGDAGNPQPQAGATTSTEPQAGESQSETISLDEARKLRSEAANLRSRLKTAEAKATELDKLKADSEAATLTETQKLQKEIEQLRAQVSDATTREQTTRINAAIQVQAQQQGIDARLALKLIERDRIVTGEDGQPSNLDTLFKEMVKEFSIPTGKVGSTPNVGATSPARSQTSALPALSWEVITELQKNPAEYNARNATGEISRWLQAHPFRYGQKN